MTTSKNPQAIPGSGNENIDLLANGSSGEREIDIDQSTSGADRWYAQIEGPSVSFYFEIPSVETVGAMLRFLEPGPATKLSPDGSDKGNNSLVIGKDQKAPITLLKDDEYPDRFFLVVGVTGEPPCAVRNRWQGCGEHYRGVAAGHRRFGGRRVVSSRWGEKKGKRTKSRVQISPGTRRLGSRLDGSN